jgi:hypothetical protein
MKSGKIVLTALLFSLATGCGGGGSSPPANQPTPPPATTGANVINVTVNGSLCSSSDQYPNKACVSVTVCTPGTSTCQTINDILLDTGSTGLRIFKQALTVPLTQVTSGSGSLAECIQYGDGTEDWGPVQTASVILGNEPAVQVPIHVIDATFGTLPKACATPEQGPSDALFNGVLGVSLFAYDCGAACTSGAGNDMYFSCSGSDCPGTTVPLASQVQNPVALLPQDNNGVIVQLPAVAAAGEAFSNGQLVFGIGTQSNNAPSGVAAYPASATGDFTTVFNSTNYTSFIDSGSNGLFINAPASLLPVCSGQNNKYNDWFCPPSTVSFTATNTGATGSPSGQVPFQIGNATALFNTSNYVFSDLGGTLTSGFDWGLPFFYGRNVIIGIEGKSSSLGSGPYWAY